MLKERMIGTRRELLMTQGELAKAVGVSVRTVQSWEQGVRSPSLKNLRVMKSLFDAENIDFCVSETEKGAD